MASPNIFQAGLNLAGTVFQNGPTTLQLGGPVFLSGLVQWVDTIDGDNSNAGSRPELPVATLAQAVTNSAANGVIVIGEGSSESLSSSQTLSVSGLSIFGCGTGSSRPRYTCTGVVNMWNITTGGVWIEGFYFPASTAAATSRIACGSDGIVIKDCYFECGASDTNRAVNITGNYNRIDGCSFVVTASRPAVGIEVSQAISDPTIDTCTFDGGSYGWSDYALKVSAGAARVRQFGNTFTNQSDIGHTVTATTYQIFAPEMDGTSNVLLTA